MPDKMPQLDILILSNGPGELATWVKPVVSQLRQRYPEPETARISVVLSPCPNAGGREAAVARSYPEVNRVQGADRFFSFLLWGRTADQWDWCDRGVVVFLGGDQIYPVIIAKRLGYPSVVYAEWEARWQSLVDAFGVMQPQVIAQVKPAQRHKFTVVGDLMADVQGGDPQGQATLAAQLGLGPDDDLIGLLPGSKAGKLRAGVPFMSAIADQIKAQRPQAKFVLPVAPALSLQQLAAYGDRNTNPVVEIFDGPALQLIEPESPTQLPYLQTEQGSKIFLWQPFPAYEMLTLCRLCITTVGANTAELGALGVPMVVVVPTQQLDVMRAWDGLPGLLVNLPGVGTPLAKLFSWVAVKVIVRQGKLLAWPNIWAKREIVPELIGRLTAAEVCDRTLTCLNHPEQLIAMSQALADCRGQKGAAARFADLICQTADKS
jgi:lipid A disaccharide synthetase